MTVFGSMLNNTGQISKLRRTPDGQGGWAIDYTSGAAVDCRLRDASSSEREVAQKEERQITHVLYLEIGQDIARGDMIMVDGLTVEIDAIKKTDRENDHLALEHLEIDCLERQEDG